MSTQRRFLVVGASGVLGRGVAAALREHGEVIEASRSSDVRVDLTDPDSIRRMYEQVGTVDGVACAAGSVSFKPLRELTREDHLAGMADKFLGQVELVQRGIDHVVDDGSFTLVSGILAYDPIITGASAAPVNAAVDGYVRAAAIELPRGLRINAVSATVFEEAWDAYGDFFPGYKPVSTVEAGRAFVKSALGRQTGQVYQVGY